MRKSKIILSLSLCLLLLAGCGEKNTEKGKEGEKSTNTDISIINTFEGITLPVFTEDLSSDVTYNPTMLSTSEDPAFFSLVNKDNSTGVVTDYSYNQLEYKTPFLFSGSANTKNDLTYTYKSKTELSYENGVLCNTGKQFILYKNENYLYEASSPTTLYGTEQATGIAQLNRIEDFADVIDNVEFVTVSNITITSDIKDKSKDNIFIKYADIKASIDGSDTQMKGIVAGIEYDDTQYYYICADKDKNRDYSIILDNIEKNTDFDAYNLISESNNYNEPREVSFDASGTAATITVPSYFRYNEIANNIYSEALLYVPDEQRDTEYPLSLYPKDYGSTEVYLTNEYYNLALTYNNYVIPEDCTTEYEMLVRVFGINHGEGTEFEKYEYGNIENNPNIEEGSVITDKDGNAWESYFVRANYKDESNYPLIIPYYRTALIYVHKLENSYQIFSFSCGWGKWWNNESIVSEINNIISSYTSQTSSTETPPGALNYFKEGVGYDINTPGQIFIEREDEATPSDATFTNDDSGDVDEGSSYTEFIETGDMKGTSTGDKDMDEDGFTQEQVNNMPFINPDEE